METVAELGRRARTAARTLSCAGTALKNRTLEAIAASLEAAMSAILTANREDVEAANKMGMTEFRRMMEQYEKDNSRRRF